MRFSKWLLLVIFSSLTCSPAWAVLYQWKDEKGLHFTDNASAVPPEYRDKASDNARIDTKQGETEPDQAVEPPRETDVPAGNSDGPKKRVAKKAKQYHRGKMLSAQETTDKERMALGCYLSFSIQPGLNVPWNSASYQEGVMQMDVQTRDDCVRDCRDNARQQELSATKGWDLYATCSYDGQELWKK